MRRQIALIAVFAVFAVTALLSLALVGGVAGPRPLVNPGSVSLTEEVRR